MLSGLDFAVAYLDDILLKSENPNEHKKNIVGDYRKIQAGGKNTNLKKKMKSNICDYLIDKMAGDQIQQEPVL